MRRYLRKRWGLAVSLVFYVFTVMLAAMVTAGFLMILLDAAGLINIWDGVRLEHLSGFKPYRAILPIFLFSIFLGTAIAAFFSKRALRPIRKLIAATRKVAGGDFGVRVETEGINELAELAGSFNKMTHELSSIETLRRDFVNNFSHEFKTPIVSIRGFAKLLRDAELTDEERRDYLEIIITESERLAELSTNVLNLSKYEAVEIIAQKAPFRIDEQIRRAIVMAEPKWSAKGIEIDIEMDEITFIGNENLTQQIWINLLDNAIKFSGQNESISVRLADLGGAIRFAIKDNGVGMDEETKLRIFDRFFQGDTSHAQAGNGLGLTIVKRVVDLCGGTIDVESTPGTGSVFAVELPR